MMVGDDTEDLEAVIQLYLPVDKATLALALQAVTAEPYVPLKALRALLQDPALLFETLLCADGWKSGCINNLLSKSVADLKKNLEAIDQREAPSQVEETILQLYRERAHIFLNCVALVARASSISIFDALELALLDSLTEIICLMRHAPQFAEVSGEANSRPVLQQQLQERFQLDLYAVRDEYLAKREVPHKIIESLQPVSLSNQLGSHDLAMVASIAHALLNHFDQGTWGECEKPSGLGETLSSWLLDRLQKRPVSYDLLFKEVGDLLLWGSLPEDSLFGSQNTPVVQHGKEPKESEPALIQESAAECTLAQSETPIVVMTPDGMDILAVDPPNRLPLGSISNIGSLIIAAQNITRAAESVENLVEELVNLLLIEGPFERIALLELETESGHAIPVYVRGKVEQQEASEVAVTDKDSLLLRPSLLVRSFEDRENSCSPFGSRAFALAPIDAVQNSPVALYADSGQDVVLSLDARRIFRVVSELMNGRVRKLPGSIPKDITAS